MVEKLLPCPFCNSTNIDPEGWKSSDGTSGPACDDCCGSANSIVEWNTRPREGSPPPAVEGGSGEQHEAWLNIYKRNGEYIVKALDPTPERAEVRSWMGIDDRIACVRIEFTDPTPPALEKTGEKP